ncbi:FtsX-like permease family protein [Enterococcus alcedinis]|uniref:FtsX-like permease family protein n=1 Tax=Enterococcus alcedinis TaxID=1274384 RepID=UPI0036074231
MLRHPGRVAMAFLTLLIGTSLLVTSVGDNVETGNKEAFDAIFDVYGPSVLDIGLYGSFTSAVGTGDDSEDGPSADVNQDIQHLYQRYLKDPRVEFAAYTQAFDQIEVSLDSETHAITSSGNVPVINRLVAGKMPTGAGEEVVVPESFAKKLGKEPEALLGKTIDFSGKIVRWEGNEPIFETTKTKAVIVGVMDTTMVMNSEGEYFEYVIEDSFLFSHQALTNLLKVIDKEVTELSFVVRAKTPQEMLAIRDELNQEGIVPSGHFEVVEDLVRLGDQSTTQTTVVNRVMIAIVFVFVAAVYAFTALLRRREYAIFKLSGYDQANLTRLTISEGLVQGILAFVGLIVLSPVINQLSTQIFSQKMLTAETLPLVAILLLALVGFSSLVTELICRQTTIMRAFKVGKK